MKDGELDIFVWWNGFEKHNASFLIVLESLRLSEDNCEKLGSNSRNVVQKSDRY